MLREEKLWGGSDCFVHRPENPWEAVCSAVDRSLQGCMLQNLRQRVLGCKARPVYIHQAGHA